MLYAILIVVCLVSFAAAFFYFLRSNELASHIRQETEAWQEKEGAYTSELAKLEKIRHIPDVIEKARKTKADTEAKLAEARRQADEILQRGLADAQERSRKVMAAADKQAAEAAEALRVAKWQAQNLLEAGQAEAKELASKTRKDAKEKRESVQTALDQATLYAMEIRQKADRRAEEIAGEAYLAKGKLRDFEATAEAFRNRIEKYEGVFVVPATHVLDELAEEFGFNNAAARLKLARDRTRLMQGNGTAASCAYPDGWKKDHALKFVLGTFNGKVDTVLSRLKPGNQGKLIQEIKDAYAMVNKDGEVYRNARIQEEYLDSRLEEVKWGVAVLKLKRGNLVSVLVSLVSAT